MRRGGGGLALVAALLGVVGCSRADDGKHSRDLVLGPRAAPRLGEGVHSDGADGSTWTAAQLFDAAPQPSSPETTLPVPSRAAASAAATTDASPPARNPDDAVLVSTRAACGACFRTLRAGPGLGPPTLSVHVALVVVPTGSVSRVDATSDDTDDREVLSCIERTVRSAVFADNDGGPLRAYEMDVDVSATGGRATR